MAARREQNGSDIVVGLLVTGVRVGRTVGRIALVPVRVAGRAPIVGPALGRATAALAADGRDARARVREQVAGPVTDEVARSLAEHRVVERVANEVLTSPAFEEAVAAALEDERAQHLVERGLASPGLERMVISAAESHLTAEVADRVLRSPEVRSALTRQTTSFAEEFVARVRRRTRRLDDAVTRRVRPRTSARTSSRYGGMSTRAVALVVDVAIAELIVLIFAAVLALVASLVGELRPAWLVGTLIVAGSFVIVGAYFVLFWSVAGQTPGMRLMRLRVVDRRGRPPGAARSVIRYVGLLLAIVPLFAGFLPILVDERRRGLQDFIAGTVVRTEEADALEATSASAPALAAGPGVAADT